MEWINNLTPSQQFALFSLVKIGVAVFAVVLPMVAYSVVAERRVSAWIQDRVGPNRVGIPFTSIKLWGLGQPAADGVKFILKEDYTPAHVRKVYFWLAPAVAMVPALLTLAVIPFGSKIGSQQAVIANLNVGILYTFGIVSLGVYGIVLAGYASNSKYPFLGGIRSSAQMISYEIAMGMSVVPVFMLVGDLNLGKVIAYQANGAWLVFKQPVAFAIFLIAAFAETNRLPFDEIRAVLPWRISRDDRCKCHDGGPLSRRLDIALCRTERDRFLSPYWPTTGRHFHWQAAPVHGLIHLGAMDASTLPV